MRDYTRFALPVKYMSSNRRILAHFGPFRRVSSLWPGFGSLPPSVTLAAVGRRLDDAVGRLRTEVARLPVGRGPDQHQVAASHLAWTVARAEAARACRDWADETAYPLAGLVAELAEEEALAFADGRSTELHALGGER